MSTIDWKSSAIFEMLQRQVKNYNPLFNLIDICIANQAAPNSPSVNDCYYFTGDVTSTVFAIAGVTKNSFLVWSTVWSVIDINATLPVFKSSVINEIGKNKANPALFTDGFLCDYWGNKNPLANYGYTDFIPVVPGEVWSGRGANHQMRAICFYNAAKTAIQTAGSNVDITTVTITSNVYFVIATYYISDKTTFQFEKSAVPTAFEAYYDKIVSIDGKPIKNSNFLVSSLFSIINNTDPVTAKAIYDYLFQNYADKAAVLLLQKNGSVNFNVIYKINPSGSVWAGASTYNNKWYYVFYKGITSKIINRISIPLTRNFYANTFFTDGITVKIFKAGVLLITKIIPFSEVNPYNSLLITDPVESFYYNVDFDFPFLLSPDEILFVGVECNAATDKIGMVYKSITADNSTEYSNNYTTEGSTAGGVTTLIAQPATPASAAFRRIIRCSFLDYSTPAIEKTTEIAVSPSKIYTVCNDINQSNLGFSSRNYAVCLYVDHFLKLSIKKNIVFDSTHADKLPLFAPIATDNSTYNGNVPVKTTAITDTLTGVAINDIAISLSHISTKASLSQAQFPKILCIGDSVTNGTYADNPSVATLNNPTTYWSYIKKFFELDKIDAGSGHQSLMIGKQISREFVMNGNTIRSFAEGRGGWAASNYLYDQTLGVYTNYFYDASKTGVKFSLVKYLSNYKTLADDGITRLTVGSTAGALVTDVNAVDICTPTHVIIQLGFNDVEGDVATNIQLMINVIKDEFPNMIVIISLIDAAGTYFPELYPDYDHTSIDMLNDGLHGKMYNLIAAGKAMENVNNKIFFCPNYFIQPTAEAVAFRNVNFPESLANSYFQFKTEHGAGNNYHPNTYAHAAWGYQLYALIKYTLTL